VEVVEVVEVAKKQREGAAKIERGGEAHACGCTSTSSLELAARRRQGRRHGCGALYMYIQCAARAQSSSCKTSGSTGQHM
jgi:S-adenosylmethionine:tRNA-ribosyltransferase-isomerase (queuine synthetase)